MARPKRKIYLIVDGYNVLRSGSRYQNIAGPDYTDDTFNRARDTLINDVASYANANFTEAIIVFDGGDNLYSTGEITRVGGVKVMFSPTGSSADKEIEKLARELRERELEAIVVTSDASIQDTVFGGGIDRMSANGFCREISAHLDDARLDEMPNVAHKNTIEDRLDPVTLAKLKALRDRR